MENIEDKELLTKQQIIDKLESDISELEIDALTQSFKELRVLFEEATSEEKKIARAQYEEEIKDIEIPNDFVFERNPLDARFSELAKIYKEKKQLHKKQLAEQMEANYEQKKTLIEKLQELTSSELSNIGASFKSFYDIRDAWAGIGDVNQARYKQLQHDYSHLVDLFYYNIGVHKELQNYDLQKNGEMKEKLIAKLQGLKEVESIRQLEHYIKKYQNEWDAIGPTTQEKWAALKEPYWNTVNGIYEKIKLHYQGIRERQKERVAAKENLLSQVKEKVENLAEEMDLKAWNSVSKVVQGFQEEWKQTGFSKKGTEENLWNDFKANLDVFYEKKSAFFGDLKKEQGIAEKRKMRLIEEAESLQESKDWNETSKKLIKLQNDWKKAGRVAPKLDQKLWSRFRKACDAFFTAKKTFYDTMDDRYSANLEGKKKAVDAISKAKDEASLQESIANWYKLGHVPKGDIKKVQDAFDKAVKKATEGLKLNDPSSFIFKAKVEAMKLAENGENLLEDERRFIKNKLDKLRAELEQYENNLTFFGQSKGAQKLKEVVEVKMNDVSNRMDELKKKLGWLK